MTDTDYDTDYAEDLREWVESDGDPDYAFWQQRPSLLHVYRFARSRRVAPAATLACVLRRAVSAVPPNVMIPPIIGGAVSLNLFTTTLGRSGQGKDAADNAGFAAIVFPTPGMPELPMDAPRPQIGTGEGLARLFKGNKQQLALTAAHLVVPEVTTLAAIAGRQGATLSAELLKAYMGQALGFSNSNADTTTAVPAHSYRLCLGINSQPENASFFLDRTGDGFPQRFLWSSALDPHAPMERPAPVEPMTILLPTFGTGHYEIVVPEKVWTEMDAHRTRVLIGDPDTNPLDGHLMLTRLKVAFALAILDLRSEVDLDDWRIAGQLIVRSSQTRAAAQAAVDAKRKHVNRARAHDQAERDLIVADRIATDRQKRVWAYVHRKLSKEGRVTRRALTQGIDSEIRSDLNPVLESMVEQGEVILYAGIGGRGDEFELAEN